MENLPRRGIAGTCCACSYVSFGWEIVRDSPMVNIVSQTKHNSLFSNYYNLQSVYVAWKRKMFHDVIGGHQAYIHKKVDLWRIEFCSSLRPRAVSRLRDEIIRSLCSALRAELRSELYKDYTIYALETLTQDPKINKL